jgi:putative acetyltransferase
MYDVLILNETPDDYDAIKEVNDKAFRQKQEGDLVEKLRKKTDYISDLSLIAIHNNKIIGHILFFPVTIKYKNKEELTLSLAPMAVLPEYQNKGVGGTLIRAGLKKAKKIGFNSVVVLGHPGYYPRFGFRKTSEWNIKEPFGVPDEAMMAIELKEGCLDPGGGIIAYPNEYYLET